MNDGESTGRQAGARCDLAEGGRGGGAAAAPSRRRTDARVEQQPSFVLHTYPWRETSLIAEVLTRDFGRVALVARGAKRRTSQLRGLLSPFSALALSWSGRGEVRTLVRAEWTGGLVPLHGEALLAGFYLNELVVRLLARADAHPSLFASYARALRSLAGDEARLAETLRGFEADLLRETGHLPSLDVCADGEAVDAGARYRVDPQRGLVRIDRDGDALSIAGSTALAMAAGEYGAPPVASEARAMLRLIIRYHLDGRPLNTRRILQDLREL
jgi:DNA repair protein RecO (recombination protein O)